MCDASGKSSGVSRNEPGDGNFRELSGQVEDIPVICDIGRRVIYVSCSSTGIFNCHDSNISMRTTSGEKCPIKGYGDVPLTLRSTSSKVSLSLRNVEHVPSLSCHLVSLRAIAVKDHTSCEDHEKITLYFSRGEALRFPSIGKHNFLYVYQLGTTIDKTFNTVIVPTPVS